jgi:RimJ/RimL family protein N-acetyltransferase
MTLLSKTIHLRLIEPSDAEFVLRLRTDKRYNQFLSSISPDLEAQRQWIVNYKQDENNRKQFYFIIKRNDGVPCGTIRIYDLRDGSFSWGSWILNEDKTRYAALESAFLIYEFGFKELGFTKAHFEVIRENDRVIAFHEKMGAIVTDEDDLNVYFQITQQSVAASKNKFINKLIL